MGGTTQGTCLALILRPNVCYRSGVPSVVFMSHSKEMCHSRTEGILVMFYGQATPTTKFPSSKILVTVSGTALVEGGVGGMKWNFYSEADPACCQEALEEEGLLWRESWDSKFAIQINQIFLDRGPLESHTKTPFLSLSLCKLLNENTGLYKTKRGFSQLVSIKIRWVWFLFPKQK